MTRAAIVSLVLAIGACARPAPRQPSELVKAEVAQAEAAERQRKHDVARVHFQRAIAAATDPASIAFARREYADTLASWGEVPEAIAQLERALAAVEDDPASWHDLGLMRHNQGDHAGAITALERARKLAPKDPRPRIALAALRWKLGDRTGAQAEYRALLELDLPDRVRVKVEWALEQLAKP